MPEDRRDQHTRRDGESLIIMGSFFAVLALLVLVGTFFEAQEMAMAVSLVAGGLLLLIGIGAVLFGLRLRRRSRISRGESST